MNEAPNQKCPICYETTSQIDFYRLSCDHNFCKKCLIKDWTGKINTNQIDENFLKCPTEYCGKPLNISVLKELLPKEIFTRYDNLKMEQFQTNNQNEKKISCPKCSTLSIIEKNSQYFKCPTCKETFCANEQCFGIWKNHEKINCKQYKRKIQKESGPKSDTEFENYINLKNWRKCPVCVTIIEKIKNCNYVTCESKLCQKKTTFCYLCGFVLKESERSTHYLKNNAYNSCDKRRESELKKLKLNENEEKIKCVMCGNIEKQSVEILENSNEKICKCMSKFCKLKYFCLICQQRINEEDVEKHIQENCEEIMRVNKLCSYFVNFIKICKFYLFFKKLSK